MGGPLIGGSNQYNFFEVNPGQEDRVVIGRSPLMGEPLLGVIPDECGKNEVLSEGQGQPWCQNVCNEEPKPFCTLDIYYGCVCKEGYTRLYYDGGEDNTLGPCVARCPKPKNR
ncbi:hypothetical protein Ddc_12493 [Ditylenchus destructor]|nr:hypothetical protein Ddc_12493 [Ditylenchus destructor]